MVFIRQMMGYKFIEKQDKIYISCYYKRLQVNCWDVYNQILMSFDRLKNLLTRTFDSTEEDSFISQAANFITSSRRANIENDTSEFDAYLQSLPTQQLNNLKNFKHKPNRTASLRPQLVKRCYENVPRLYFDTQYEVSGDLFTRNRKESMERTVKMHEQLDEVELCLFNQISSRFDEILSVLRTIESLECVVVYNAEKLGQIRRSNMQLTKQVSQRHIRIVNFLRRQEHLKATIDKINLVKVYSNFLHMDKADLKLQRTHSQHYQAITQIRGHRQLYFQLAATKNFEERVEQSESTLKRSFSDTINDSFFKYTTEIIPYESNFWQRKFMGRNIFQQEQPQPDGTVILDESVLIQQDGGNYNTRLSSERQLQILDTVLSGYREGQYTVGNIKAAFDRICKQKHIRFLSQCRNYCFQTYLREQRKKIENPSISNLLSEMNVTFCSKTFTYYCDMYRTLISRTFSLVNRTMKALIKESMGSLTIEDKQKLIGVVDGFFNVVVFVFKLIYDKVIEVIDLKQIHDTMELNDFKQLINVVETQQEFIEKNIKKYLVIEVPADNFLYPEIAEHLTRFDLTLMTRMKEQKVLAFLSKTHKYILENELRDSFQNQIWQATDIPTFYYDSLHYLITGESLNLRKNKNHTIRHNVSSNVSNPFDSSVFVDRQDASMMGSQLMMGNFRIIRSEIIIDHRVYKVTETLLLMLEIIEDYLHLAQYYPFAQKEVGIKVFELLRAYNTSSSQLIIFGGAVKLQKIKTKNITAKHLALNSLCLSFLLYIMDCIIKRVPIYDEDKIRKDIEAQQNTAITKLNSILSSKVAQSVSDINLNNVPSKGTEAIVNNTKTLHDILVDFFQKQVLARIFTRENTKAYLNRLKAIQVTTKMQAQSLKDDFYFYFHQLRFLQGIVVDFTGLRLQGQDLIKTKFEQL